jgi:tryptophan synthase alpha chain
MSSAAVESRGVGPPALEATLRARRDAGRKLLVPYVTGGLGLHWVEVIQAMVAGGADAVEVGIPFSDPVMDGPTIQEASVRALQLGATPPGILGELARVSIGVPLIAMTYYNLVFRGGHRRFAHNLVDAGIAGIILPDVPLEELGPWSRAADDAGVETVLLAAPVTTDDRLAELCRRSRGFVYGVNLMGVTGERAALAQSARRLGRRLKAATDKPVLMGFGVSTPEQAVEAASCADGVIVASALMRILLDGGGPERVGDRVAEMRAALDAG